MNRLISVALGGMLVAALAACTTSNTIDGHQVRGTVDHVVVQTTDAQGLHERAPQWFRNYWAEYLGRADGGYAVMAADRNGRGAMYYYCRPGSGCHILAGAQNKSTKDLRYKHAALEGCRKYVREQFPAERPACEIYAIKDKIVWKGEMPWK